MVRREQQAEDDIFRKKETFIKRHADMMAELFKMMDVDHNETISMGEMEKLVMDKNKMTSLKVNNLVEDGMLRTVMLSIFDFWDQSSFDFSEKTREFSQKEFSGHIINSLANPNAELLFCGVATRKMVHDLSLQVHEKLDRIDETLRMEMAWLHSVLPAKEDQLRP